MTKKKITTPTTTPQDGEETKILKTKNGDIMEGISETGNINLDPDVLQSILKNQKSDELKNISSIIDIEILINKANESLDTNTIKECIQILESYKNNYLNTKINTLVEKFLEQNQITDMDEKFLALSEDTRILICIYRSRIKKYGYSCGGGFGYYKTPTGCGGCISGRENMEKANLDHLAKYIGDRQYQVPEERIQDAQSNFIKEFGGDIENPTEALEKIIKIYSSKLKDCEEKIKYKKALDRIKMDDHNLTDKIIFDNISGFVDHIKGIDGTQNIQVDIQNKVAAYIQGTSRDSKSAGMEYGNYVAVRYDGKRKDVHVVYRDAYSSSRDDRSLCFNRLEIKNIETKDEKIFITVRASSDTNSRTYTFDFPLAKKENSGLSKEDQEKFTETFETKKQEILLEQIKRYESNTMPVYCLPPEMTYNNMPGGDVPYIRPTISSEYIDKQNGIGVIVIYKQIDHCAAHKRQLAREGWLIKADGTYDRVEYENMRDTEKLSGKQIKMFAQEIVQNYVNKKSD
ncbi:hypothetical protein K9M48_02355 [Candidatus Gracilibacteria bacterium]|nr:hypothetical protein [Candidatus Gracilibacteria bacterium]